MTLARKLKEYYEKEALELEDHQNEMYSHDGWNVYWHGTRLQLVVRMAKSVSFKSCLDVGCAEGYYIGLLNRMVKCSNAASFCVVGLDVAQNYLLKAKEKERGALLVAGDIHKLPLKGNVFDFVLCSEVLEHVLDPELAFKELARVSKEYVLVTLAGENLFHYAASKIGLVRTKDPFAETGQGHINEARIGETIIPWSAKLGLNLDRAIVTCYFPPTFLQKLRIPLFSIAILRLIDRLLNKIPILRESGAVQIVLLEKASVD